MLFLLSRVIPWILISLTPSINVRKLSVSKTLDFIFNFRVLFLACTTGPIPIILLTIYIKSFRILLYFPLHIWCGCSAVILVNTTKWPLQRNSFLGNYFSSIPHTPFTVLFIHPIMYHWRYCLQLKQMRASLNNTLKNTPYFIPKGIITPRSIRRQQKTKNRKLINQKIFHNKQRAISLFQ